MSNTVNPSTGLGTTELKVTIIPVQENTVSVLRATGYGLSDTVTFEQYDIVDIDPDGDAIPICETITYEADADKVEYHIIIDGETVYSGYAYRYPDEEGNLKIEVNDILSDYLKNHISFTEGLREMDGFLKEFTISTNYGSQDVLVYNG